MSLRCECGFHDFGVYHVCPCFYFDEPSVDIAKAIDIAERTIDPQSRASSQARYHDRDQRLARVLLEYKRRSDLYQKIVEAAKAVVEHRYTWSVNHEAWHKRRVALDEALDEALLEAGLGPFRERKWDLP